MRFVDFLRATVMLSAGAATTLGVLTVLAAGRQGDDVLVFVCAGWWIVAAALGTLLGRRAHTLLLYVATGTSADIEASRRDLGFEPSTPISAGIPKFIAWYKGYYGV